MELLLAIVAGALAVVSVMIAVRAHRASRHLALEMVQLRDRLARAEQTCADAAGDAVEVPAPATEEGWAPRVAALERRLREALEFQGAPDEPEEADPADARAVVRQHLRREGHEHIVILDVRDDGSVIYEAERHGATTKGRAEILEDGSVRVQAQSSVRAFP
jgi:hypothetical protein